MLLPQRMINKLPRLIICKFANLVNLLFYTVFNLIPGQSMEEKWKVGRLNPTFTTRAYSSRIESIYSAFSNSVFLQCVHSPARISICVLLLLSFVYIHLL